MQGLYYKRDEDVASDTELQAWWTEITTKGHADADPAGWPDNCKDAIKTVADLAEITTTMAWMASAHHAAGAGRRGLPLCEAFQAARIMQVAVAVGPITAHRYDSARRLTDGDECWPRCFCRTPGKHAKVS